MKLRTLLLVALILFVGLTSITTAGMNRQKGAAARLRATQPTDEEIINILFMRQEEKFARDVYLTLYEEWEVPIFANISESEQRHMDALKRLIDLYDLEDPVADMPVGQFENQDLSELYIELTELGVESIIDAFSVGVTIEELDIADLQADIEVAVTRNVKRVFENLLAGSENHLAAFEYNLNNYDPESPQTCVNDCTGIHSRSNNITCINCGTCQQICDCDGTCINQ